MWSTGYNLSTQVNDAGLFYNTNASQGFVIGPWASTTSNGIRLDSNGNTTITGSLTLSTAMTLPSSYSALPASTCLGYQNMATTTSGSLTTGVWLNLNSTPCVLTAGTWLVTASCVFTGTSTACTSVQGAISTSNSSPDSYAARTNMPCVGFAFAGTNAGVASFTLSRVFALTTTQNVYLLQTAYFTYGSLATGGSGMAATRLG